MEKTLLEKAKEALVGKYIVFGGLDADKNGFLSDIIQMGRTDYSLIVNGNNHYFGYKYVKELCEKGESGPTKVCKAYDLRKMFGGEMQAVSAENEHTSLDVWKERWWQTYFHFAQDPHRDWEMRTIATNEFITRAMQEMDKFFNNLEEEKK